MVLPANTSGNRDDGPFPRERPIQTTFENFFAETEPRLRRSLTSAFGAVAGRQAAIDALSWAWEYWPTVQKLDNPIGYLHKVGRSQALKAMPRELVIDQHDAARLREEDPTTPDASINDPFDHIDRGLSDAVAQLTEPQRAAVLLVDGFGYTLRAAAEILDLAPSTVHKTRLLALEQLRSLLGVDQ